MAKSLRLLKNKKKDSEEVTSDPSGYIGAGEKGGVPRFLGTKKKNDWLVVGGDWNHGILNDFPETVGNGINHPN